MRLPMFPLGAVLLPGQVLPLHVFEERYQGAILAGVGPLDLLRLLEADTAEERLGRLVTMLDDLEILWGGTQ